MFLKSISALVLGPHARRQLDRTHWVGELVRAQSSALVRAAVAEGLEADEALDVVQSAAMTLLQRRDWQHLEHDLPGATALLVTLVQNTARNTRRRSHRAHLPLEGLNEDQQRDDAAEALELALDEARAHVSLIGCIDTLAAIQRAVVVARFFDGESGRNVAAQLNLSAGNVAVILHRAKGELRSCLQTSRKRFGTG